MREKQNNVCWHEEDDIDVTITVLMMIWLSVSCTVFTSEHSDPKHGHSHRHLDAVEIIILMLSRWWLNVSNYCHISSYERVRFLPQLLLFVMMCISIGKDVCLFDSAGSDWEENVKEFRKSLNLSVSFSYKVRGFI